MIKDESALLSPFNFIPLPFYISTYLLNKSLFIILLLFFCRAEAQDLNITSYSLSSVFPSSYLYTLHQDTYGNIWMGTGIGVCRYDGYEFKSFDQKDGIPGSNILKLFPQENGDIWGVCQNLNLFYFNADFNGFHTFSYNDSLQKYLGPKAEIKSLIVIGGSGEVLLGGYKIPPLFRINESGKVSFDENDDLEINYACLLKNHFFLSSTRTPLVEKSTFVQLDRPATRSHLGGIHLNDTISIFMGNGKISLDYQDSIQHIMSDKLPIMLKRMTDSSFAVGYYLGGVKFFNLRGEVLHHFIKDKSVSDMLIDHNNGYWFSTLFSDLLYLEDIEVQPVIKDEFIADLEKDKNKSLFIGFRSGKILKRQNGRFEDFYIPKKLGIPALFIYALENDSLQIYSSACLLNNEGDTVAFVGHKSRLPEFVVEQQTNLANNTWPYHYKPALALYEISKTVQLKEAAQLGTNFYISTNKNELLKYDSEKDTTITITEFKRHYPYMIQEISADPKTNTLYLSMSGGGLLIVNEEKIIHISEEDGLSSDYLYKVYVENDTTIWVGTSKGPNAIIFNENYEYDIFSLNQTKGLIPYGVTDITVIDDTVWVGNKSGLYYFPKKTLLGKPDPELFFRLKNVLCDGDTLSNDEELNHDQNTLSFYLNAVSFNRNESLLYHYRIIEIDEDWRTTKNREIIYQDLNPGTYTFEAKVELEGYFPDDLVEFNFTIAPPFYQTWWFYSLYVLLAGLIIYLFFKIRVLTYNKDVVRELMRYLLRRIKKEEHSFVVRSNGQDIKIFSETVLYVKSAGNYLELFTSKEKHIIRGKISTFIDETTDPLEYLRVHRSYIIRIDKVDKKGKNWVVINGEKIPVGESYLEALKGIQF